LRYSRKIKLPAVNGTLTLNGQDASLTYGRSIKMTASLGTLTLAGQVAALRRGKLMTAGTGAIVVTGRPANLARSVGYRMAATYCRMHLLSPEAGLSRSGTEQPGTMEFGRQAYLRGRW